jgi:hypothetical protein
MQHAAYLFLDRVWEKDQQTIKNVCGYYKSCQSPLSVRILNIICLFNIQKEIKFFHCFISIH